MQHRKLFALNLTALLAVASAMRPVLDGTPPDEKDKKSLTQEEWEAKRREELNKSGITDLVNRVVKLETDNQTLRVKQAPEGGRILTAEEVKRWEAWEKFGKPDEVGKKLEQADKDRAVVEKQEKRERLNAVAEAAGWDAETFADLNEMAGGLEWTVQEVKKDGETIKNVTVKVGDKTMDAEAYAEERWKKFLPVLTVGEGGTAKPDQQQKPEPATKKVPTGGNSSGKSRTYSVEEAAQAKAESGAYLI